MTEFFVRLKKAEMLLPSEFIDRRLFMIFHGFQKMTMLDFPGYVACTVFTPGCNFRCPFCHNSLLVTRMNDN